MLLFNVRKSCQRFINDVCILYAHLHGLLQIKEPHHGLSDFYIFLKTTMFTLLQLTIEGKSEFVPPRLNYRRFLDHVFIRSPALLEPSEHGILLVELARFAGLKPDEWGMSLDALRWLFNCSPDLERACRRFRADAF